MLSLLLPIWDLSRDRASILAAITLEEAIASHFSKGLGERENADGWSYRILLELMGYPL